MAEALSEREEQLAPAVGLPPLPRHALAAGLLIIFLGLVSFLAPSDYDVWWHLRNGRLILDSGLPHTDVYSHTAAGREWLVQEWLTEVGMFSLQEGLGYIALVVLFGGLQAAGSYLVYRLLRRNGVSGFVALLLLCLYAVFAAPTWGVRPQVLTPIFLATFYLILLGYRDRARVGAISTPAIFPARLWLLPLLTALWCNLHASYFIGIGLVGAFLVGEAVNNLLYRPERTVPLRPLLFALGGCLLATLLNPYFIELWTYPLTYVLNGTGNPLLRYTNEWQSPNFHEYRHLLLILSFVLLMVVGLAQPVDGGERHRWRVPLHRYLDVTEVILLLTFTVLGLQAARLLPLYAVIVLPLLAGGLARLSPALNLASDPQPSRREGQLNWLLGGLVAVLLAVVVIMQPLAQTGVAPRTDSRDPFPAAAASYLRTLPPETRIFNEFSWGGYLIYRLYPQQRVFIDGRADMYRVGIFDDYIAINSLLAGWRERLTFYKINTVIVPPGSPLADALEHEAGWQRSYQDGVAAIYRRR